jgi:hypothetical protein
MILGCQRLKDGDGNAGMAVATGSGSAGTNTSLIVKNGGRNRLLPGRVTGHVAYQNPSTRLVRSVLASGLSQLGQVTPGTCLDGARSISPSELDFGSILIC